MRNTKTITTERIGTVKKAKALAAGLLVAGMIAAGMMAGIPAHAATTFVVDSTSDESDASATDGLCKTTGGACTLRAAIQQANATLGADVINFDIPGTGVKTITPSSALPTITERATINGYTQPGASPNTLSKGTNAKLRVELDGSKSFASSGLRISDSSNSVIKGLVINRFGFNGVGITGDSANAAGNRIEGNFIGTDPTGTIDEGNGLDGVFIGGSSTPVTGTVVGGNTPAKRNLISGNEGEGVEVSIGANSKILGNLIGTTAGGTGALGNDLDGVELRDQGSSDNEIGDGTAAGSNTIAFNGRAGLAMNFEVQTGNASSRNSIFSNAGLGIDLKQDGPTPNDPGDADVGPNGLQNFPVLASAKTVSGKTTIKGTLSSVPSMEAYTIQFFSNPSGTDEGKTFIGQKSVTTDASGNASFTFSPASKVATGKAITATATNASSGDTSEFSAPRKVTSS
jgi:CSLREA domain-containing protein